MLKNFTRPTLVMRGEKSRAFFALTSEAITKCVPGAQQSFFKMSITMGPSVIRQHSPLPFSSFCRGLSKALDRILIFALPLG
jgi:hypothetical protein